jgi:hypothetical protein
MNFDKVIGVSFNRRSEFMGDHLRLKTILDLNIQAESISSSGGDSFSGTQGKIVSLENQAFGGQTFYQNITSKIWIFKINVIGSIQIQIVLIKEVT